MAKEDLTGDLRVASAEESQRRPRRPLDELLTQCDSKASKSEEEREWLDDKPVGGELI
jgi:antitoxin ChpS